MIPRSQARRERRVLALVARPDQQRWPDLGISPAPSNAIEKTQKTSGCNASSGDLRPDAPQLLARVEFKLLFKIAVGGDDKALSSAD
jgi:hypothetical protein